MWTDLVAWFQSPGGARVLQTAIVPAVAILVAGVLAALIGRAAVRAAITRADRVEAAGAVAGLVEAARAATEPDPERGARRRAARLRTEADVRTRLLPLPGAATAADWAAARTHALQQRAADGPVTNELDELRDRLVAWVSRPGRAKRIFAADPVAAPATAQKDRAPRRRSTAVEAPPAPVEQPAEIERPAAERADAVPERPASVRADAVPAATGSVPSPARAEAAAAAAAAAGLSAEGIPAWQRTRSGERLQQERATRGRAVESPTDDSEPLDETHTAPVQRQHPHRSDEAASAADAEDAEEAIRLEAHQQARHARPVADAGSVPTGAVTPGQAPARAAVPAPAWLDVYDDEAQVTQNMDLKTPPPVAASAVRDRGAPGEDLVPRS